MRRSDVTESIYLVRHAQSIGNVEGSYDVPDANQLSERGAAQAERLATVLRGTPIDVVACSSLERAQHTIVPYLRATETVGEIWAELAEGCYQEFDERRREELRYGPDLELPAAVDPYFTIEPDAYPACERPENETFAEAMARVERAATRIEATVASPECDALLVVSHYHFLARLVERLLDIEPGEEKRFSFDNASVTKLTRRSADDQFRLRYAARDPLEATGR